MSKRIVDYKNLQIWVGVDFRHWALPLSVVYAARCLVVRVGPIRVTSDWSL